MRGVCSAAGVVVVMMAGSVLGQTGQGTGQVVVSGIVSRIEGGTGGAFVVVDRAGEETAVRPTLDTVYQAQGRGVSVEAGVKVGMEVRVTVGPGGTALQVISRGFTGRLNGNQLKPLMGSTDEEWRVLEPLIEQIQELQREADGDRPSATGGDSVQSATAALKEGLYNGGASVGDLRARLEQLRKVRAETEAALARAQAELQSMVTSRQEVMLVLMGVLR